MGTLQFTKEEAENFYYSCIASFVDSYTYCEYFIEALKDNGYLKDDNIPI